jgi:hypothetical protein
MDYGNLGAEKEERLCAGAYTLRFAQVDKWDIAEEVKYPLHAP